MKKKAVLISALTSVLAGVLYLGWPAIQDGNATALIAHEINGRDEGLPKQRTPVYRVKTPADWLRKDPAADESIADSKRSLCEFLVVSGDDSIRIAIHNFPTETLEERIPPAAQILRWKRQFDDLDPSRVSVSPQSFGGFTGLLFIGTGHQNGQPITVIGWSMQIGTDHYRHLCPHASKEKIRTCRQMRADYTIKASGPTHLMEKHTPALKAFANSFELIEEIPVRS